MKSVSPLDVHRLREFYDRKNEVAVNVDWVWTTQTNGLNAEETADDGSSVQVPREARITVTRRLRVSRGHREPSLHHDRSERIRLTYVRGSPAQSSGERVLR
jgi:hypothetical protein